MPQTYSDALFFALSFQLRTLSFSGLSGLVGKRETDRCNYRNALTNIKQSKFVPEIVTASRVRILRAGYFIGIISKKVGRIIRIQGFKGSREQAKCSRIIKC